VRRWVVQAQVDGGQHQGVTTEELAEIKKLKAENKRLREDIEILRAATTFFVGKLDPRNPDHGFHRHHESRGSLGRVDLSGAA
jgi:transposase